MLDVFVGLLFDGYDASHVTMRDLDVGRFRLAIHGWLH